MRSPNLSDRAFSRPCPNFKTWLVMNSQGDIYPMTRPADAAWFGYDDKKNNFIQALAGPYYGSTAEESRSIAESDENYEKAFTNGEKWGMQWSFYLAEPDQRVRIPDAIEYYRSQEKHEAEKAAKEAEYAALEFDFSGVDFSGMKL